MLRVDLRLRAEAALGRTMLVHDRERCKVVNYQLTCWDSRRIDTETKTLKENLTISLSLQGCGLGAYGAM